MDFLPPETPLTVGLLLGLAGFAYAVFKAVQWFNGVIRRLEKQIADSIGELRNTMQRSFSEERTMLQKAIDDLRKAQSSNERDLHEYKIHAERHFATKGGVSQGFDRISGEFKRGFEQVISRMDRLEDRINNGNGSTARTRGKTDTS